MYVNILQGFGVDEANDTLLKYNRLNKLPTIPDCWREWDKPINQMPAYDKTVDSGFQKTICHFTLW